jgi:hypothetical protein
MYTDLTHLPIYTYLYTPTSMAPGALTMGPQGVAAIRKACPALLLDVHVVRGGATPALVLSYHQFQPQSNTTRHHTKPNLTPRQVSDNIEALLQPLAAAGATRLTLQLEQLSDPAATLRLAKALGVRVGVCVQPATPVDALERLLVCRSGGAGRRCAAISASRTSQALPPARL